MDFGDTYVGKLRSLVGNRLLLLPGARVVVENACGEILLQKRSDFGVWGLPGGNAEEGEDLEVVATREVQEETGLIVSQLHPFGFGCDPALETVTFPNGDCCQFFVLNCQRWNKTPPLGRSKNTPLICYGRLSIGPVLRRAPDG